mmetsp:Transcript_78475/g.156967  ORF Transcript_78475/g.156967 Transcript_78475/m.156967 type:complete len:93 (+) Transcript_78475:401-679(+)
MMCHQKMSPRKNKRGSLRNLLLLRASMKRNASSDFELGRARIDQELIAAGVLERFFLGVGGGGVSKRNTGLHKAPLRYPGDRAEMPLQMTLQ